MNLGRISAWKPPRMSYEEFLQWADEDTLAEWVDGEIEWTSAESAQHQRLLMFLMSALSMFAGAYHLGQVLIRPYQMKLVRSGREPGILFVATEHLGRMTNMYLNGPADLVVEILSPESAARDLRDKFYEYQAAGIPEYWLIDPLAKRAEFYRLDASGSYQFVGPDAHGVYRSRSLVGFWLRVDWLWQAPLPTVEDALIDVLGEEYLQHQLQRFCRKGLLPEEPS